jgi:hypothetical protein
MTAKIQAQANWLNNFRMVISPGSEFVHVEVRCCLAA